ncbi:MAG: serine/threonine-protein kinase [Candidatus Krumholzibacteriia bacterium]
MPRCPQCQHEQAAPFVRCPTCGRPADDLSATAPADPDVTTPAAAPPRPSSSPRLTRTSAAATGSSTDRFPPGTILSDRYHILRRLGAGAMGEVYLAEDLTLDQQVALKFLSPALDHDEQRRQRFLQEVRLARQIAHPNVCRVYDVGEVDGQLFLSMEYVDGRDLASMLRSIGRLPQEKALDVSRQLCAGLAALHDRGVLHRDLKPANIMLDEDGRLRITDFGLAGVTDRVEAGDIRSGTPLYMAPEQLAGREVTQRSDIYALGLVLYEIFTGRKAYEADTLEQLYKLRSSGTPARLSTVVEAIDPAVERVVNRCLESDPDRRPKSALLVATALPGGDPLAAALAMGETPSPELVAAAGGAGGLHPALGLGLLAVALAGLLLAAGAAGPRNLAQHVDVGRSADALEERCRQLVVDLGYDADPVDRYRSFAQSGSMLNWWARQDSSQQRWDRLAEASPSPLILLYRQSPSYLTPLRTMGAITSEDPPPLTAGMIRVVVDAAGRLLFFTAVPPETLSTAAPDTVPTATWDRLFAAAALDRATFAAAAPGWVPDVFATARKAWHGGITIAGRDVPLRVEAATLGDKVVSFRVFGPWFTDERTITTRPRASGAEALVVIIVLGVLAAGVSLALRNHRRGRTDLRGAGRLAGVLLIMPLVRWAFANHHGPQPNVLMDQFFGVLAIGALFALLCLMLYLALEPVARRIWPSTLIGWTRLLGGRWRDPMVGRSILIGGAMAGLEILVSNLYPTVLRALGEPPLRPQWVDWVTLATPRALAGNLALQVPNSLFNVLFFLMLLVLLRLLLRRRWPAYVVFTLVVSLLLGVQMPHWRLAMVAAPTLALIWTVVLVRGGLLAFAVAFYLARLLDQVPLTLDFSQSYAATSLVAMALITALLVWGLVAALGGRQLLSDEGVK